MMLLRGINFLPVYNAAGAQGFFGEGYPFHRLWRFAGLMFKNCGFIAKTTTLRARAGNMPLAADRITPQEWKPRCIVVKPVSGVVLNSDGLSGPGATALFEDGRWQRRVGEPFFLSFMSVQPTANERLAELRAFVALLHRYIPDFNAPVGLEMNFSCPNAGIDPASLMSEVGAALDIAAVLGISLQLKFNATVPVAAVCDVCQHSACDALTMSNTIPWGQLPERIDWLELFGTTTSPLAHLGGGGLSGWPLTLIVCGWIRAARNCGFQKPIWACGGIDSHQAVHRVQQAGASGVQLGVVGILRPWRMRRIIRCAHELFS